MCIFSKCGNCNHHDLESYGFEHKCRENGKEFSCSGYEMNCPFYCDEEECK